MIPSKTYGTMYYVDDMNESVSFYEKALGFKPGYQSDFWTEFNVAGHLLCLHAKNPGDKTPENGILIFYKDGIQQLHDGMKGDGYSVFGLHKVHEEMYSFHCKDKSNNEFSFYGKIK